MCEVFTISSFLLYKSFFKLFRLTGKCNWATIAKVDRFDRVDFVCPTLKISVNLLDGYSRPIEEMNENLYQMKWNGTENLLKSLINNGTLDSFCDPKKSSTCK